VRKRRDPLQISERELIVMTSDLEDRHHETLPKMYEAVSEWAELGHERETEDVVRKFSRRGFLAGTGVALGGAVLAACGSSSKKSSTSGNGSTTTAGAAGGANDDVKIAALATSLENLAVATYQSGIDAATAGKLGKVPPAVVTFAQTAQKQHKDHAAAWNAIIKSAGQPEVTGVDSTVKTAVVDPAFAKVTDVAGLAKLALQLEEVAAATYLASIGLIKDPGGIKTSASIQPVEMQHAAILHFVLGDYPVPRDFASTDGARGLTDKIA
jgi:hypothetical protein